ncbi:MAG: PadR family transcriptional regulator [Nocardioides sp.]|uniref:PadR family transcriptional regulator n=1 Tax=Nocardioides sp. TaxID=35761 RepID=UPI0039E33EDC
MALEHALLVALREQPAAGLELSRRFDRSIGFFWSATHQQIYRVLARMDADGWVRAETHPQADRPAKKVYAVTDAGARVLADWLATPADIEPLRSELTVKMRGASYGDRETLLGHLRSTLADHEARLSHFRHLLKRDYPEPAALTGPDLDQYLVLKGGVRLEEFWIDFLTDYLTAHERAHR